MSTDDQNTGTTPQGPTSRWMMDWVGSGTVMAGCTFGGFAFIFPGQTWLWIIMGVLIVAGTAVWIIAGPGAASRRERRPRNTSR